MKLHTLDNSSMYLLQNWFFWQTSTFWEDLPKHEYSQRGEDQFLLRSFKYLERITSWLVVASWKVPFFAGHFYDRFLYRLTTYFYFASVTLSNTHIVLNLCELITVRDWCNFTSIIYFLLKWLDDYDSILGIIDSIHITT